MKALVVIGGFLLIAGLIWFVCDLAGRLFDALEIPLGDE